eukprot:SAG31_NODE_6404_length_2031_cov_9.252070_2_plen_232_part_00
MRPALTSANDNQLTPRLATLSVSSPRFGTDERNFADRVAERNMRPAPTSANDNQLTPRLATLSASPPRFRTDERNFADHEPGSNNIIGDSVRDLTQLQGEVAYLRDEMDDLRSENRGLRESLDMLMDMFEKTVTADDVERMLSGSTRNAPQNAERLMEQMEDQARFMDERMEQTARIQQVAITATFVFGSHRMPQHHLHKILSDSILLVVTFCMSMLHVSGAVICRIICAH